MPDDREPRRVRSQREWSPEEDLVAVYQPSADVHLVFLSDEDYDFICKFDPDRDRTASRADMVKVVDHIKYAVIQGRIG